MDLQSKMCVRLCFFEIWYHLNHPLSGSLLGGKIWSQVELDEADPSAGYLFHGQHIYRKHSIEAII